MQIKSNHRTCYLYTPARPTTATISNRRILPASLSGCPGPGSTSSARDVQSCTPAAAKPSPQSPHTTAGHHLQHKRRPAVLPSCKKNPPSRHNPPSTRLPTHYALWLPRAAGSGSQLTSPSVATPPTAHMHMLLDASRWARQCSLLLPTSFPPQKQPTLLLPT